MLHRTLTLPPHTASPAKARRFVESALQTAKLDEPAMTAALLVSELVTNAVLHAGTRIEVEVRVHAGYVRVGVTDGTSAHARPQSTPRPDVAAVGRGTQLLDELADGWGTDSRASGGKTVWFELHGDDADAVPDAPRLHLASSGGVVAHRAPRSVVVELLDVPVEPASRAVEHHEELLRELALVSLNTDRAPYLPQRLLELADRVRAQFLPLTRALRATLAGATERGEAVCDVRVELPVELREDTVDFAALHAEAEGLARQGWLLTLTPADDVVRLRCWLLGQLAAQLGGAAPVRYQVATQRAS